MRSRMRESASTDLREPQGSNPLGPPGHDPTLAHLWRRLAALPVTTPTRPHLASVIRHPAFAIRLFCFPIPHSKIRHPHFTERFQRSQQLSVPGGLVAAVPLECRAAIQRCAVVPLVGLVGLDFLM